MNGRIRPIEQYVAVMVSVFSENIIKTMSAEKTLLRITKELPLAELKDLQKRIVDTRKERGFVTDPLKIQILLSEEVGEISAELKRLWSKNYDSFSEERVSNEIADTFVLLSALASEFGIDLESAVESKFFKSDSNRTWASAKVDS